MTQPPRNPLAVLIVGMIVSAIVCAAQVTLIQPNDTVKASRATINTNFTNLYNQSPVVLAMGAPNVLTVSAPSATLVNGQCLVLNLGFSLAPSQTNTINLNSTGPAPILSHFNPANGLANGYIAGGFMQVCFDGSRWRDMSQ